MAMADYHLCDNCGAKTFYDANLEGFYDPNDASIWLYGWEGISGFRAWALCKSCEETHQIVIVQRHAPNPTPEDHHG